MHYFNPYISNNQINNFNSFRFNNSPYKIINYSTGKALEVKDMNTSDGGNVIQYDYTNGPHQKWILEKIKRYDCEFYIIRNVYSRKVLDVEGYNPHNGGNIFQWQEHDVVTNNQLWYIQNEGNNLWSIISLLSNKAIEVTGGYPDNGVNVQQWTPKRVEHQLWRIIRV